MSRHKPFTLAERQDLQKRIARSRRRLDRHVGRLMNRSLVLGSWSGLARGHFGKSLLAAAGVGVSWLARMPMSGNALERLAGLLMGPDWSRMLAEVWAALDRFKNPVNENPKSA